MISRIAKVKKRREREKGCAKGRWIFGKNAKSEMNVLEKVI